MAKNHKSISLRVYLDRGASGKYMRYIYMSGKYMRYIYMWEIYEIYIYICGKYMRPFYEQICRAVLVMPTILSRDLCSEMFFFRDSRVHECWYVEIDFFIFTTVEICFVLSGLISWYILLLWKYGQFCFGICILKYVFEIGVPDWYCDSSFDMCSFFMIFIHECWQCHLGLLYIQTG